SRAEGQTKIYDCLVDAVEALSQRPERRRAVLVISDGMDNQSKHSLDDAKKRALTANVVIFTVDLIGQQGSGRVTQEEMLGHGILRQMAEKTGGRYLLSGGGLHLNDLLVKVVDELRNQYTIGYYSTNDKRDGKWRKVEVQLPKPDINI